MTLTVLLNLQLLLATTVISSDNCTMSQPPAEAGETQAHGDILYTYPRSHTSDSVYDGCQNQWFLDEGKFRKLNIAHLRNGEVVSYDSLNINGEIAFCCNYAGRRLSTDSDGRCQGYQRLKVKTFAPDCYSKSAVNRYGSYSLSSADCVVE